LGETCVGAGDGVGAAEEVSSCVRPFLRGTSKGTYALVLPKCFFRYSRPVLFSQ